MAQPSNFIEKLLALIQEQGKAVTFAKGDFIIKAGDVERNLYFIESCAVIAFLVTETGEQVIRFGYDGSIINSLASYIKGAPSELYI